MGITKPGLGRQRLAYGLIMCFLLGTIVTLQFPAVANHPTNTCLNVEPETDPNPVGTTHTLTATLVGLAPSPVPSSTCAAPPAGGSPAAAPAGGTQIDFEVETGPPVRVNCDNVSGLGQTCPGGSSNSDSGPPPDMSCTIPSGQTSCQVFFTSDFNGTNRVRGWVSEHPADTAETRAEDDLDTTDVVEKTWTGGVATSLDCEPETDSNPAGDPHTVTCTARQGSQLSPGQQVDAEATGANDPDNSDSPGTPDFTCTARTDDQGRCSFTHGPGGRGTTTSTGTTIYRAWVDADGNHSADPQTHGSFEGDATETRTQEDGDTTDVVEKSWFGSPLECLPETDSNPAGTSHTITCTSRNELGGPSSGTRIHAEATGANSIDGDTPTTPDFNCTTNAEGTCSFTHEPPNTRSAGVTLYRAWVDTDNNPGTFDGDAFEGRDEGPGPGAQPGAIAEPDKTDVVEKTWVASNVDCNPETDRNPTGSAHSIVCRASDETDANVANTQIDLEAAGANDPDGSESFESPDFSCVTSSQGTCTVVHGPGGVGRTDATGTTIYAGWVDADGSDTNAEVDRDEGRAEGTDVTEPDNTDVVEKTWVASLLDCSPESDTNPAQTAHTITCSARDQGGFGAAGVNIDVEATGPNDPDNANSPTSPDFSCITGSDGACSFTHGPGGRGTTAGFGRTIYRAWIDVDGNDATAEADATEGRDETAGATPSPTPSGSPSPAPTSTSGASSSGSRSAVAPRAAAMQQTPTPTPTPTQSPTPVQTPSQSPTPSQTTGGSPSPRPTPTGTPAPTGPGHRAEPDDTDVVEKNWSAVPTRLDIAPETDSAAVGSCNAFTITATDASARPVENVVIDVEQRHERSDNQTANDEPTVSFCRPGATDGANPSDVDPTRGDLGTGTDGNIGGEADRATDAAGKVTIGIRVAPGQGSNGTGNVLVTVFYENEDNDDADTGEPSDTATKTWVPSRARTIDCSPEQATNRVGTNHVVSCTIRDANGQPAQGEGVTFTEDGPGTFTTPTQRTSSADGVVTATVTSDEPGEQTITGTLDSSRQGEPDTDECDRAANDPSGSPAGSCSDTVEKTWARRPAVTSGPCENFFQGSRTDRAGGGKVIVGTSGDDELRGSPGADLICGLGGNDRIRGAGGNDRILGGGGRDRIRGNSGRDRIKGGPGNDRLKGGPGADTIRGGGGNDLLRGGGGKDDLDGGGGNDVVDGGRGRDDCAGGRGRDELTACE